MEQAIGTRIGASSWRGTEPSSSGGMLDCFVVPPRNDVKGSGKRLDCFVVPPRNDGKPVSCSDGIFGSSWRGTKPSSSVGLLDCFVVPPRNDEKGRFVVPPRNDGKRSTEPAPSLRTEGEAIQKRERMKKTNSLQKEV